MTAVARTATEAEVKTAADYFSSLSPKLWIRVIEADRVPRTHVAGWMLVSSGPAAAATGPGPAFMKPVVAPIEPGGDGVDRCPRRRPHPVS
jgi:hypothetical protein